MSEYEYKYKRINDAIWYKKNSISQNKFDIDELLDDILSAKIEIRKTKDNERHITFLKSQIKIYTTKIKKLKKETYNSIKELKIYEAEYKKTRKDPNYNINFNLLKKKYNKNNTQL